jgi:CRP-like cAMP-binding protein
MLNTVERSESFVSLHTPQGPHNKILAVLPKGDYERLAPSLTLVPMRFKDTLHKQGERIERVLFPCGGALSLIKNMNDGLIAEITTIGNEGVVGAHVFLGEAESIGDTIVQVPDGGMYTMPVDAFNAEMYRRGAFYNVIMRYQAALTNQIMQTSVCNSLHSAEERACRWLLMTHDRVGRDEFQLTHEFMAGMLGVRRPTVTLIAGSLQRAGLIAYRRGRITIVNRDGLESASCECYEASKASYRRLMPELSSVPG